MNIEWQYLSTNDTEVENQISQAMKILKSNRPFLFIVKKGSFSEVELNVHSQQNIFCKTYTKRDLKIVEQEPKRIDVLNRLVQLRNSNTLFITTTGYTSRELFQINHSPNNFYMVGSMGCASAIALGLAKTSPRHKVVAIDGDGALLMHLGSMATNAYYSPPNMFHLLLDNCMYESTGKQMTVATNTDFVKLAAGVNYKNSIYLHNLDELMTVFKVWQTKGELTFAYLRISSGTFKELGRPDLSLPELKIQFMDFIKKSNV